MKRVSWFLAGMLLCAVAAAGAEEDTPHRMLKADGEVDTDKCGACHEADMTLSRSKAETCTLCHAVTLHSGAADHLAASADAVAGHASAKGDDLPDLPLTDDGRIFCGTCHFFHDPRVSEEKHQTAPWIPAATGVAGAVRDAIAGKWPESARARGETDANAKFADRSTRALRQSVSDGALCRRCHGSGPR